MFRRIDYGIHKTQIRALLRKRLDLKDRLRYHKKKIGHHESRIAEISKVKLVKIEKDLDLLLVKANKKYT